MRFKCYDVLSAALLFTALLFTTLIAVANAADVEKEQHCDQSGLQSSEHMLWIEGGTFRFGTDDAYREEGRAQQVEVPGFWMKTHEVTNDEFAAFVEATGYKTVAETELSKEDYPDIPDSQRVPGSAVFVLPERRSGTLSRWWEFIPGANWRHPDGPASSIEGKGDHPVVQIAYQDAEAYAKWKGEALPTERQWEHAAKGKFQSTRYAWGDSLTIDGEHQANTWQGLFPMSNSKKDGYVGRAPVGCFPADSNGLYDMIGNVWEWTSSWYHPAHQHRSLTMPAYKSSGYDPQQPGVPVKVLKGGSFLCAPNACRRYRPSARHSQDMSLGSSHIGFRTVINKPKTANINRH